MPKSKVWPYPLVPGTHVIAKVYNPMTRLNVQVAGTVMRSIRSNRGSCLYAVKTTNGMLVQTVASRTIPVDTSTEEGADIWMDAIERALKVGDEELDGVPPAPGELELQAPPQPYVQSPPFAPTTTTPSWWIGPDGKLHPVQHTIITNTTS